MKQPDEFSMSWQGRMALLVIVGGTGIFIIGAYAGLYDWPPMRSCRAIFCDPYHWQILAIGIAFFCAGLAYVIPSHLRALGKFNAMVLVTSLLAGILGAFAAR